MTFVQAFRLIAFLVFVHASAGATSGADARTVQILAPRGGQVRALVMGINNYSGSNIATLNGASNRFTVKELPVEPAASTRSRPLVSMPDVTQPQAAVIIVVHADCHHEQLGRRCGLLAVPLHRHRDRLRSDQVFCVIGQRWRATVATPCSPMHCWMRWSMPTSTRTV